MSGTAEQFEDALSVRAGKRPLHPTVKDALEEVNWGTFERAHPDYLHIGRGQFAIVYRLRAPDGRLLALRCLTGNPPRDAGDRTNAIDDHLRTLDPPLPYFVRNRFYPDALFVETEWKSLFVMDWIEGEDLLDAVERLVREQDTDGLSKLAEATLQMIAALQAADIAHGDLQHGNIRVTPTGEVRLVDYDSVYVPALQGKACPILGTEGYGHPVYLGRQAPRPFNATMDTFSALVIALSLQALAVEPTRFRRYTLENLLLSDSDLTHPNQSPVFDDLLKDPDPRLSTLTQEVLALLADHTLAEQPLSARSVLGKKKRAKRSRKPLPSPRLKPPKFPSMPPPFVPSPLVSFRFMIVIGRE